MEEGSELIAERDEIGKQAFREHRRAEFAVARHSAALLRAETAEASNANLREQVKLLAEGLQKYGEHKYYCVLSHEKLCDGANCDCGLAAIQRGE